MAQAVISTPITAEVLRGNPARLRRERRMRALFFSAALLSVLISIGIVLSLLGGTIDFLRKVDLSTLWSDGWLPRNNLFDVKTIVVGTLSWRSSRWSWRRRSVWAPLSTSRSTPRRGRGGT
jgi:ABC-type phosphate transport system permease subunit